MKDNILFKGVYPAIFSVYDENLDVIDETVKKMVDYQLDAGVQGFYVGGNTGECTVLPAKTRKQMLESVVKHNAGRGKIIAHIGAGHFDETMDLLEHANSLAIDAVASLPPTLMSYYSPEEIVDYYIRLADKSKYPLLAYVTPVLGCDVTWFVGEIMKHPNVIGVKISIPDYYEFGKVLKCNDGNINLLNGPDETMICGLAVGAHGAIGTTYNFAPKIACKIYEEFVAGNVEKAREYQVKLNKIIDIGLSGRNLSYWKGMLSFLGFDMGATVFPGIHVTDEELNDLKKKLDEIDAFNQ